MEDRKCAPVAGWADAGSPTPGRARRYRFGCWRRCGLRQIGRSRWV